MRKSIIKWLICISLGMTNLVNAQSLDELIDRYRLPPSEGVYHCRSLSAAIIDFDEEADTAEASPGQTASLTIRLGRDEQGGFAEVSGVNEFNLFPVLRANSVDENEFYNPPANGKSLMMNVSLKIYQTGAAWFHVAHPGRGIIQLLNCVSV